MHHRTTSIRFAAAAICAIAIVAAPAIVRAHVYVLHTYLAGAYEHDQPGSGWKADVFYLPVASASHLLTAETYMATATPDFTFRTPYIDFPAGPVGFDLDANFATMGDFLNDYIYDVSDPARLSDSFRHFIIRFRGFLRVRPGETIANEAGMPTWVEFGSLGHDGFGTRIVDRIYRLPIVQPDAPFMHENAIVLAAGVFPIEITYFNRYDPTNASQMQYAGIELYSYHEGGLPWPGGANLVHEHFGQSTVTPPNVIYQSGDVLPLLPGDFENDDDVDVVDYGWFQTCYTGAGTDGGFGLDPWCITFDFDVDDDVDGDDYFVLESIISGGEP